jgi:hypothetical protein
MSASRWSLLLLAASSLLAGCQDAEFSAISTPPPGREATLRDERDNDDDERSIRLTRGVALAFSCTYKNDPCRGATAKVSDSSRIQVLSAHVDELYETQYVDQDRSQVSAFVVFATTAGRATLTVDVEGKSYDFDVTVVDP